MTFDWRSVDSTAVDALAYHELGVVEQRDGEPLSYGRIYVRFKSGAIHEYPGIEAAFLMLLHATSVGQSLWHILVPGSGKRAWED